MLPHFGKRTLKEISHIDLRILCEEIRDRGAPSSIMKMSRPHRVYLSRQAQEILVALNIIYAWPEYLHPGRFSPRLPLSDAALNAAIRSGLKQLAEEGVEFESFSVHDLCVGRPARFCTRQGITLTGSKNVWRMNSGVSWRCITRRNTQSNGHPYCRTGRIWLTGVLRNLNESGIGQPIKAYCCLKQ